MTKNKFSSNKKTKIWKVIALALASVLCIGAIAGGMGILKLDKETAKDKLFPKINSDNLYSEAVISLESMNDGNGVEVEVDERTGAIVLDGTAEEDLDYVIGTVKLDKGEYILTAVDGASKNTIYVSATAGESSTNFDFRPGNTLTVDADDTVVTLTMHITYGTKLNNVKVLPCISGGDEPVSFYK